MRTALVLLKSACNTLAMHPIIFFPFCCITFIHLLTIEIIFFAPRYPLSIFFGPLIRRLEGEMFTHYPYNFMLLQKWFSSSWLQIPVYVLFYSLALGAAVMIIEAINREQKLQVREMFRNIFSSYAQLIVSAILMVCVIYGVMGTYGLLIKRAMLIRSTTGQFFLIKKIVILGAPYFQLLSSCVITALFAFVVPVIMLEKKNVFNAVLINFKRFRRSFVPIFTAIFLSGLLYIPVILLKTNTRWYESFHVPELWGLIPVFGIAVMLIVDAVQITAIMTHYLVIKESRA